jgi:cytochrome c oxidase assembly protein subunit 15
MDFNDHKSKKVANWLLLGVFMTVIQVALGGITRLTGSGLSITEWDVVTGALPPMSETTWQELFAKYKTTPQFQLLNFDFTIANFKFIFFGSGSIVYGRVPLVWFLLLVLFIF